MFLPGFALSWFFLVFLVAGPESTHNSFRLDGPCTGPEAGCSHQREVSSLPQSVCVCVCGGYGEGSTYTLEQGDQVDDLGSEVEQETWE